MKASAPGAELVESLVRQHRAELLAFVRLRAGHLVDAEDVLQQASVRALAHADNLRDPARGRAWLFRIVRNTLTDQLRAMRGPLHESLDEERMAAVTVEEAATCSCALNLAKSLKPESQAILERAVLEEVPVSSVATELGVTQNNAMVRLHRARRALRELVAERCGTTTLRACLACSCDELGSCAH
jgi:RNA polymerase sigma-70 factor (ECF subfamily)